MSESSSAAKLERIRHSAYLSRGERSLYGISGDLFTFGFSMSDNDRHILRAIRKNRTRRLFVALHGPSNSEKNESIAERAMRVTRERDGGAGLELYFYDASSARVWGEDNDRPDERDLRTS